ATTASPTFGGLTLSTLNSTGVVHTNASGVLSTSSVVLGTDTSGAYVANLGVLTGLTATGNSGSGSTPTLSVNYGATANTAVQGNTTFTCPSSGTNLSGGGNTITEGSGGSCNALSVVSSPSFSGLTLTNLNSAGVVHNNASGVLSTSAVVLGTDTTGNYVANLGTLVGL